MNMLSLKSLAILNIFSKGKYFREIKNEVEQKNNYTIRKIDGYY